MFLKGGEEKERGDEIQSHLIGVDAVSEIEQQISVELLLALDGDMMILAETIIPQRFD